MNEPKTAAIKILVVEDNADVARSTARVLEQSGYVTAMAANGVDALKLLAGFQPDLVLSDCDMPEMGGVELCRRIKGDPAFCGLMVILISNTQTHTEQQSDGLDSGADSYIVRPIANRELVARVAAFVRILRLNRALQEKNAELAAALARVKLLSGILPICAGCKKIRDDRGNWRPVENYVQQRSEATFSHGMCPDCTKIYFPELTLPSTPNL